MEELEKSFASNTCRCTGYRSILDTMKSFAVDASPQLLAIADIEDLDKMNICQKEKCGRKCSMDSSESDWTIVIDDQEYVVEKINTLIELEFDKSKKFYKVYYIKEIFEILNKKGYDSYMLVAGNTAKGNF